MLLISISTRLPLSSCDPVARVARWQRRRSSIPGDRSEMHGFIWFCVFRSHLLLGVCFREGPSRYISAKFFPEETSQQGGIQNTAFWVTLNGLGTGHVSCSLIPASK